MCSATTRVGITYVVENRIVKEGCNCNQFNKECTDFMRNPDGTYDITVYDSSSEGCSSGGTSQAAGNIQFYFPGVKPDGSCTKEPAMGLTFAFTLETLKPSHKMNCPWTSDGKLVGVASQSNPGCQ